MLSMTQSGQLDFAEMLFNFLKSVQNLLMPSMKSTTMIGELQGDLVGFIIFATSISVTVLSTIGMLGKRSLVWSQFNRCIVTSVNSHLNWIGSSYISVLVCEEIYILLF